MGYYMTGDFYRRPYGDYYRGDPGFWSTIGGLAKGVVGMIPGVGPTLSGVIGGIGSALAKKPVAAAAGAGAAIVKPGMLETATKGVSSVIKAHPVLTAAGAAGIIGAGMGAGATKLPHLLRGGGGRRHRRMRVTNPKALRRAIRRTQGFAKLAMKTIHLVHPKKHARFGGFKRRARKR